MRRSYGCCGARQRLCQRTVLGHRLSSCPTCADYLATHCGCNVRPLFRSNLSITPARRSAVTIERSRRSRRFESSEKVSLGSPRTRRSLQPLRTARNQRSLWIQWQAFAIWNANYGTGIGRCRRSKGSTTVSGSYGVASATPSPLTFKRAVNEAVRRELRHSFICCTLLLRPRILQLLITLFQF